MSSLNLSRDEAIEFRKLLKKSKEAVKQLLNIIIDKMNRGKAPNPEEIRFLKQFSDLVETIRAKQVKAAPKKKEKLIGKLKKLQERKEKLGDVRTVMEEAGYYLCDYCLLWHAVREACPFKVKEGLYEQERRKGE